MIDITLKVSGKKITGWKSVAFKRELNAMSSGADFVMSDRWGSSLRIPVLAKTELFLSGERVITGWPDDKKSGADARGHDVKIGMRSMTCDLVDCSILPDAAQMLETSIKDALEGLLKPYKIPLRFEADDRRFNSFIPNAGDSVGSVIEKLCKENMLLYMDAPDGGLRVFDIDRAQSAGKIIFHRDLERKDKTKGNVLSGEAHISARSRFSHYIVSGQHSPIGDEDPEDAYSSVEEAKDPAIDRYRPVVINADERADLAYVAATERARRIAKSIEASYVYPGWRNALGKLRSPGDFIEIDDDVNDLCGKFLVSSVELKTGGGGNITTIGVAPPEAFIIKPEQKSPDGAALAKKNYTCPAFMPTFEEL